MIQCFAKRTLVTSGSGTRFNHPYGGNVVWSTNQSQSRTPVPAAGTFRNLRARVITALAAGATRTFAIYKNGTITSLAVLIGDSDTTFHDDIVNEVVVAAGDEIAIGSTLTGTDSNIAVEIAIEFESDDTGVSVYGGPVAPLASSTTYHNITSEDSTDAVALGIDDSQTCWPVNGTITRWDMRLLTAPGSTHSRTFTLYKNGAPQDGTSGTPDTRLVITGTATLDSASFSLSVAEGDLLSWQSTFSGTPAGSTALPGIAFTATVDGQFAICSSDEDSFSAVVATYGGQTPINWDTTEANVYSIGNITTFQITSFRVALSAADNGRVFQTSINGGGSGPTGTLAGGATTLQGSGTPLTITSADRWSFKTTPGTQTRQAVWGLNGAALSQDTPGPLTSNPLLRQALIHGGMVQ